MSAKLCKWIRWRGGAKIEYNASYCGGLRVLVYEGVMICCACSRYVLRLHVSNLSSVLSDVVNNTSQRFLHQQSASAFETALLVTNLSKCS